MFEQEEASTWKVIAFGLIILGWLVGIALIIRDMVLKLVHG